MCKLTMRGHGIFVRSHLGFRKKEMSVIGVEVLHRVLQERLLMHFDLEGSAVKAEKKIDYWDIEGILRGQGGSAQRRS